MKRQVAKGSKVKCLLGFNDCSLGGMTLNDVDFVLKFFATKLRDSKITGVFEVTKSECTPADDGMFYAVCDTTGLDLGLLCAELTVTYHDDGTGIDMVEKIPMVSEVEILADAKVYQGKYEEVDRLVVAGRVYAYSGGIAGLDAEDFEHSTTFKPKPASGHSDQYGVLLQYSPVIIKIGDNSDAVVYAATERFTGEYHFADVTNYLGLAGKYVYAVNTGLIYYNDGTKWITKGVLYKIES